MQIFPFWQLHDKEKCDPPFCYALTLHQAKTLSSDNHNPTTKDSTNDIEFWEGMISS